MNCKEAEVLIQKEIDGCITTEELKSINAHLQTCVSCAEEKEELLKLHNIFKNNLANIPVPEMPVNFDSTFFKKLNERTKPAFLNTTKEALVSALNTMLAPKYAIGTIAVIMVIAIGLKQYLPTGLSKEKVVVNSAVLYDVAMKKTADRELTNIANAQVKEILSIAGI